MTLQFEGIVHPKLTIFLKCTHPRDRDEVFFFHQNRFGDILACSLMDPPQWMGAVRMRVPHHNNPKIIHMTPVHQLMSCEVKSCVFVRNKSIIKMFLTSTCFWIHVDYFNVFVSFLGSHSDGTHLLQRIRWWASDVMLNFTKSVPMKKQLIYIMDSLRVSTFQQNSHFWQLFL